MISLVLGGTRSGKSEEAERRALALDVPVTYLATAARLDDEGFAARVERHRARRPAHWRTVDTGPDLAQALVDTDGPVLVDSLGTWISATPDLEVDVTALVEAITGRRSPSIIVSEEVGLSVHPAAELGRRFVDVLGEANRAVATVADEVVLVVAGRALVLP